MAGKVRMETLANPWEKGNCVNSCLIEPLPRGPICHDPEVVKSLSAV
jgi:hypothetical protein